MENIGGEVDSDIFVHQVSLQNHYKPKKMNPGLKNRRNVKNTIMNDAKERKIERKNVFSSTIEGFATYDTSRLLLTAKVI